MLKQAAVLLVTIDDQTYSQPLASITKSGIGGHIRHCLDFYDGFLQGISEGRIDYDCRERNTLIEQNRSEALAKIQSTVQKLSDLPNEAEQPLLVKQDSGDEEALNSWSRSSVSRELHFLLSHTVHHYALIAMLLRLQGFEPAPDFGVAPSTLKYWQAKA